MDIELKLTESDINNIIEAQKFLNKNNPRKDQKITIKIIQQLETDCREKIEDYVSCKKLNVKKTLYENGRTLIIDVGRFEINSALNLLSWCCVADEIYRKPMSYPDVERMYHEVRENYSKRIEYDRMYSVSHLRKFKKLAGCDGCTHNGVAK